MQDFRPYTTIKESCEVLQVIQKSKFYGRLFPVETPEQAQEIIDACKKKYWDATHNCSAYVIGKMGELSRCSDDGEPQGTAGVPMLEALKKSGLTNVLAIATRYFGGILLGAGGLVRAYTGSVAEAVRQAHKIRYQPMDSYRIQIPFRLWGKVESQLLSKGFLIRGVEYTDTVSVLLYTEPGEGKRLQTLLAEVSAGMVYPVFLQQEYVVLDV